MDIDNAFPGDPVVVNEDGVIDAGQAFQPGDYGLSENAAVSRPSAECDLVLLFQCYEDLQNQPESLAQRGTTISIGFDKTIKLCTVFSHFANFCNRNSPSEDSISYTDLEFVHNQVLIGNETAEGAALMKNDVVKVRKNRRAEKKAMKEIKRIQASSDYEYFKEMRNLFSKPATNIFYDTVIDCGGEDSTFECIFEVNSAIVGKRCPWLQRKISSGQKRTNAHKLNRIPIDNAPSSMGEKGRRGVKRKITSSTLTENGIGSSGEPAVAAATGAVGSKNSCPVGVSPSNNRREDQKVRSREIKVEDTQNQAVDDSLDDEDSIRPFPLQEELPLPHKVKQMAAEVVDEEEDLPESADNKVCEKSDTGPAPGIVVSSSSNNDSIDVEGDGLMQKEVTWVTLNQYHPQAVKLLLEYCYTNRCLPLGKEAFHKANVGRVIEPYEHWPNSGRPTISMSVALSAIELAEEANMPRFSLMCEISACQLLTSRNLLEALSLCTQQQQRTGNPLKFLRNSATEDVLRRPDFLCTKDFQATLLKKRELVVPSILKGTQEVMSELKSTKTSSTSRSTSSSHKKGRENKNPWAYTQFDLLDKRERASERLRHAVRRKRQRASK